MIETIFVSGLIQDKLLNRLNASNEIIVQSAANTFQVSVVEGLSSLCRKLLVVSVPFLDSRILSGNPKLIHSTSIRCGSTKFDFLFTINLPIIKRGFGFLNLFLHLFKLLLFHKRTVKEVLVYSLNVDYLVPAYLASKFFGINCVVIIPDLLDDPWNVKSPIKRFLKKFEKILVYKVIYSCSGNILLTHSMISHLKLNTNKCLIMEGLFSPVNFKDCLISSPEGIEDGILYAGSIAEEYGVFMLMKSFLLTAKTDLRLFLCGSILMDRNKFNEIIEKSGERIQYLGILNRQTVLQLQRKCKFLINPRPNVGGFNKFSFPSKIMEYFYSETPVLMFRLSGVPEEYYNHCYELTSYTEEGMCKDLEKAFEIDYCISISMAIGAKKFIENNKMASVQCSKMLDFFNSINQ